MEDARREIDINRRACRKARLPTPDEDEISERDMDTDEALGDVTSSEDAPSPPKKKRKSDHQSNGYLSEDRPPSSRPLPKPKVRPEDQKAKNTFKAKVLQEQPPPQKSGIKLKIPRTSVSPEVTKQKKDAMNGVPRIKSPEKKAPKSDDARIPKRPQESRPQPQQTRPVESRPEATRPPGPRAVPPRPVQQERVPSPAKEPESRPKVDRPKPRRRSHAMEESPTKQADPRGESVTTQSARDMSPPQIPALQKPNRPAPIAPERSSDPASTPLFMDPPEVSRRINQRKEGLELASGLPSPAITTPVNSVPASGRNAEEAVVIDDFPSPGAVHAMPVVKPEPVSPGGYSGSEGEVEHDLGLDADINDPAPMK